MVQYESNLPAYHGSPPKLITKFISLKRREHHWTMDNLAENLHISRQALYNYVNCKPAMPENTRNHLYKILDLSQEEQLYVDGLYREAEIGSAAVNAYNILDGFVFRFNSIEPDSYSVNFYENGIKTTYDARAVFNKVFCSTDLSCEIKIINSISDAALPKLRLFLSAVKGVKIQGARLYVNLWNKHPDMLAYIFMNLFFQISWTDLPNLKIFYKAEDHDPGMLFRNSVLISTGQGNHPKYQHFYWLVFGSGDITNCFAFDSEASFDFVHSITEQYIKPFQSLEFTTQLSYEILETIKNIEYRENLLIKTDICYPMIPLNVYRALQARLIKTPDTGVRALLADFAPMLSYEAAMEKYIAQINFRSALTHNHINICSMQGIKRFAETGKLSDYPIGFPILTREDIHVTLNYLLSRMNDPKDKYQLILTRSDIFKGAGSIQVSRGGDLLVEWFDTSTSIYQRSALLKYEPFTSLLFNYVNDWLIPRYTMSKSESEIFLKEMINEVAAAL